MRFGFADETEMLEFLIAEQCLFYIAEELEAM
jgi:hypothetical protein